MIMMMSYATELFKLLTRQVASPSVLTMPSEAAPQVDLDSGRIESPEVTNLQETKCMCPEIGPQNSQIHQELLSCLELSYVLLMLSEHDPFHGRKQVEATH